MVMFQELQAKESRDEDRSRKRTYSEVVYNFTLYFYVLEFLFMLDLMNSVSKGQRNAISLEIKYFMGSGRFEKCL